jgi:SAM-dependent methyltransferase
MSTAEAPEAGNEFVDFWNEILVPKFIKYRHILVDDLTHHSAEVFPSLEVGEGDTVVDVGCGFGDTAIQLAQKVGPSGSVLGIDCCSAFLEIGRADAEAAGVANVAFVEGDAQTFAFEPVHDFCFARFGTQFFENPVQGLRNMRTSLKPGGVMTMIVWRTIDDNPWLGPSTITPGSACPRRSCCNSCRRRARTRGPAVRVRFPWPTRRWSPSSSRSPATPASSSSASTCRWWWAARPHRRAQPLRDARGHRHGLKLLEDHRPQSRIGRDLLSRDSGSRSRRPGRS